MKVFDLIHKFLKLFAKYVASKSENVGKSFTITIHEYQQGYQLIESYPAMYISLRGYRGSTNHKLHAFKYIADKLNLESTQISTNTVKIKTSQLLPGTYEYLRPFKRKNRIWIKH